MCCTVEWMWYCFGSHSCGLPINLEKGQEGLVHVLISVVRSAPMHWMKRAASHH
jgi:hypothetical protein